jgi:ABC-2 type transport system permease protein
MSKFWLVSSHEYTRHVFRKRFLLALFSVPLLLAFMIILVIGMIIMETSSKPVGYIDHSGLLADPVPQARVKWPEQYVEMVAYTNEAAADDDLQAKKIQAYYIVPQDYLQTGQVEVYYLDKLKGSDAEQFTAFLKANLLANQPPDISNRILEGNDLVIQSVDKSQEASKNQFINIILPLIAGIVFIVAISTTSGYLIQTVTEEKENRTMEIMVTSVSPNQLMSGKVIADIAIGVTQILVWAGFIVLALIIGKNFLPSLSGIHFSGETIAVIILLMVPAFIMISGMMAAVGATVTEASEGQQIMGLFTIPIWLPYIFIAVFIQNPNSPLAIAMSLFPLTAPMTVTIRMGLTSIPTWQMIASITILVLSAIGAVWLAGRAFRLGMLRYGQRVHWKELFNFQRV